MILAMAAKLSLTNLSQYMLQVMATVKTTVASQKPQVRFTERLGTTDWCECVKFMPMPRGRKCQCCREIGFQERLTGNNNVTV